MYENSSLIWFLKEVINLKMWLDTFFVYKNNAFKMKFIRKDR